MPGFRCSFRVFEPPVCPMDYRLMEPKMRPNGLLRITVAITALLSISSMLAFNFRSPGVLGKGFQRYKPVEEVGQDPDDPRTYFYHKFTPTKVYPAVFRRDVKPISTRFNPRMAIPSPTLRQPVPPNGVRWTC
eukprot:1383194-Amorphochlora_amoeboformis.AAC.2